MPEKTSFLTRLPFAGAVVVLGLATICAAAVRFSEPIPINPWEAATAVEAMRFNASLPLYESGHATHMYGPLSTIVLALIFRLTGLNLPAARIILSIFAFALALLLATVFCRGGKLRGYWLIAFVLFLGVNLRTNLMFLTAQPDCLAILVATVALYFWATAASFIRIAVSVFCFVGAVLLKQTTAAFTLVPLVYALIWERSSRIKIALSALPAISIFFCFASIRLLWPNVFSSIITVPASIKVHYASVPAMFVYLLFTFPIFLVAVIAALLSHSKAIADRWIYACLIVFIPAGIWMICKSGGSYNSLLFAYLAMTALFVRQVDLVVDWIASLSIQRKIAAFIALLLLVLFSFFAQVGQAASLLFTRCGDDKYDVAVAVARSLGRGVISPQDPTIAYQANRYFGHALYFELDAHTINGEWPARLPEAMETEIRRASYVIEVRTHVPTTVLNHSLNQNQFHPVDVPDLEGSAYVLWAKSRD